LNQATTTLKQQPKRLAQHSLQALVGALLFAVSASLHAQGILTVTPSSSVTTSAGTGAVGNTGDGGQAISATLADPSAVAYDANGNLYLADAQNDVIREVSEAGVITTVAGIEDQESYGGDNGPANSAYLDTPTGVAVDASGNVYIADSHNHRIRKVTGGTITTIAGTGTPGFSGDTGPATAAQLSLPSAVAVDATGNIYIADTNNQRIREITGATIHTIAGNGEELFAGDGATATAAVLDSPTGVAVDAVDNIYIADRHNQRIRMVTPAGTISTLAGSGTASFSGAFAGDGASATASALAKPSGVSVDAGGNIYIADTDNQRIRQVSGGTVATVVGSGLQGFGGDSGPATGAILNSPKAVIPVPSGNLAIADKLNQRLRVAALPTLTFTNSGVGVLSATQSVTLGNTGSASITVASIAFTGSFASATGGSCSATPVTLAAGANCTQNLTFLPTLPGAATGSVVFGGTGVVPQSILLSGIGIQTAATVTLGSNIATPFVGQPITLTATVKPMGLGTPTGTVSFYDGAALLGASTLTAGSASFSTALTAGTQTLTAVYSGDTNFTSNTSPTLAEIVTDFNFTFASSTAGSQTVKPGQIASYALSVLPLAGSFAFPITLSAMGLPPGATVTFTPRIITLGPSAASFTMAIQTAPTGASLTPHSLFGKGTIAVCLILLPFSGWTHRRLCGTRRLTLCVGLLLSLAAIIGGLAGCGSGGYFGQPAQSYTINITGTATGVGGATLQHSWTVTLTVQ
jgi:sugar lactone lactonase YvrE